MAKGTISKKDPSFLAESNSQNPGLPGGPPLPAPSPGLSWATSSVPMWQSRPLFWVPGLPFKVPRADPTPAPSLLWNSGGAREQQGPPCTPLIFDEGKIASPVSCRDLINTCSEFQLLIQRAPPGWGSYGKVCQPARGGTQEWGQCRGRAHSCLNSYSILAREQEPASL